MLIFTERQTKDICQKDSHYLIEWLSLIPRKSAAELAMILVNSKKLTTPSPLESASFIISESSRKVKGWPILAMEPASSAGVMNPLPSRSNNWKTSNNWASFIKIWWVMSGRIALTNSSNSTRPFPLASMSPSKRWIWSPLGLRPKERKRAASSSWVRLPSESMSKRMNMSFKCFSWSADWTLMFPQPLIIAIEQDEDAKKEKRKGFE
ncbi:hypothetical protein ES319_A12G181800v1 [Gossypium barbadense]|uniref:Uncharacterized protein n=2 Tax=Gossypium TaxID=3633 RepID=A0A5J5THB3_GOSBA|nr:hypothetical protein ES319_A12G181800v1 [Gossypium barbadense]TYH96716.1 hypothetical protein ES332_A12G196700v1 [Gossypium tomentosum]